MSDARVAITTVMKTVAALKDDAATSATILVIWQGSKENPHKIFIDEDYDVILEVGEPTLVKNERDTQDVPSKRMFHVPVKCWCIDKYSSGSLVVTGSLMIERIREDLRDKVEANAQGTGTRLRNPSEGGKVLTISTIKVHEVVFSLQYQTGN